MVVNKIGPYNFLQIRGVPDIEKDQVELIQRPGVDGTHFRLLGSKGEPFRCITSADMLNYPTAMMYQYHYKELIRQPSVAIIRGGFSYDGLGCLFKVLTVRCLSMRRITTSVGGLWGSSGSVFMECAWDMIPVLSTTV